jgi:pyruvate,water dikinase
MRFILRTLHDGMIGSRAGVLRQAPSDYPEFATFLVDARIDSISLNPDSVITVKHHVAKAERKRRG